MRSKNRLALLLSTILCAVLLVFGMAACGGEGGGTGAKEAIDMYIFSQTLVDADFTLPKRIGKNDSVAVQWKSSNTDAIAIEDNGENYKAIVTLQDEVTEVTLTISSGEYFKDFKVNVNKLDVYTFMAKYTFAQRNTAVTANFDLDTETTFQGKKATIAWSIDEEYAEYIKIEGNKVIVTPAEDLVAVKIKATFTYNGENATQSYSFNVAPALEHRQTINRYYSVESYPLTFSGYITHLVEASESYGNATFYMIDDDFCSGYYAYRVKINTEDIAKYVDGAHVTVTGDTTKNYNGLWENNGGGTATVDDTAPINPREKVYALDTDLLSGVPSMIWHESTFVSLSGWKVLHKGNYNSDSKTYEKTTGADQNLFTLEKNGTEIVVRITKYAQRTDEELAALVAWYDSVNEGEYINVVGLLGNYNAFQIQPILASDITKATAESTNTDGAAVKAAVAKVKTESDKNFGALLTTKGEFTMPTSEQGVTISYRVAGADAAPTVTIDGGKITVDPVATEKNYDIEVTYKIGDYEAYSFFKIRNFKASATDLLALAKENVEAITLSEVKNASSVTIPTVDLYEAQISWAIENAPTWASVAGNVVTISELPTEATTLTLKATLTLDGETTTATITLAVAARPAVVFNAIEAPAAGDYIFALYQGKLEKWLYSTGIVNSNNFGETTENYAEAALFTLAASGDGWTIQLKSDGKYLELNSNHRMQFVDASTQAWKWDATYKVFTFTVGSDTYYLGTYNDFNTISASTVSYLSSSTNFVGHFGNMGSGSTTPSGDKGTENNPYTVAEILDLAKDLADGSYLQADGKDAYVYIKGYVTDVGKIYETYGLSTVMIADEKGGTPAFKLCTINWGDAMPKPETIPENSPLTVGDFVVCHGFVKNYKGEIEVDKDSAKSTYPTFTKWTHETSTEPGGGGDVTDPDPQPGLTLDHAGTAEDPYSVKDALAATNALASGAYSEDVVYVTGYVASIKNKPSTQYPNWNSVVIVDEKGGDAANGFTIYKIYPNADTALKLWEDLSVGSKITVKGYLQNYKGTTPEMSDNGDTKIETVSYADARTAVEKANDAIAAAKQSLESTYKDGVGATVSEITLPASAVTGVTLKYTASAGTIADGKLPVTHGAEETTITIDIEAESGTKVTVSLNIAAGVVINDGDYAYDFTGIGNSTSALSTADLLSLLNGLTDVDIIVSVDKADPVYKGQGSGGAHENSPDMLKVGKASAGAEIQLTFAKAVTKIVIDCESWKGKTSKVSVNGGTVQTTTKDTRATLTFEFEATTSVTIKVETSAILIYKLTVTVGSASATEGTSEIENNWKKQFSSDSFTMQITPSSGPVEQGTVRVDGDNYEIDQKGAADYTGHLIFMKENGVYQQYFYMAASPMGGETWLKMPADVGQAGDTGAADTVAALQSYKAIFSAFVNDFASFTLQDGKYTCAKLQKTLPGENGEMQSVVYSNIEVVFGDSGELVSCKFTITSTVDGAEESVAYEVSNVGTTAVKAPEKYNEYHDF